MKSTVQSSEGLLSEVPDVMTVHHLRVALGIGRQWAYKFLEEKKIRSFKIGNAYKIPKPP